MGSFPHHVDFGMYFNWRGFLVSYLSKALQAVLMSLIVLSLDTTLCVSVRWACSNSFSENDRPYEQLDAFRKRNWTSVIDCCSSVVLFSQLWTTLGNIPDLYSWSKVFCALVLSDVFSTIAKIVLPASDCQLQEAVWVNSSRIYCSASIVVWAAPDITFCN